MFIHFIHFHTFSYISIHFNTFLQYFSSSLLQNACRRRCFYLYLAEELNTAIAPGVLNPEHLHVAIFFKPSFHYHPTRAAEAEHIQKERKSKYTPVHPTRKGHFADCAGRDASAGRIVCSLKPKKATKILCSALYQLAILWGHRRISITTKLSIGKDHIVLNVIFVCLLSSFWHLSLLLMIDW